MFFIWKAQLLCNWRNSTSLGAWPLRFYLKEFDKTWPISRSFIFDIIYSIKNYAVFEFAFLMEFFRYFVKKWDERESTQTSL